MKITVYVVTTCIPERGEKPCLPSVFATEAEAEAFLEEALKSEWESNAPIDDETGDAAEYPGNWRDAVEEIAADNAEGTWGEWQLTSHEIEINAENALEAAQERIFNLENVELPSCAHEFYMLGRKDEREGNNKPIEFVSTPATQ